MQKLIDYIVDFFNGNFTWLLALAVVVFATVPWVVVIAMRRTRTEIGEAIKGENKRLDWHEVIRANALYTTIICTLLYVFMIVTHGVNGTDYELEDKVITALIAVGADATLIASVMMRNKATKP